MLTFRFGTSSTTDEVYGVALQRDGKILVAGRTSSGGGFDVGVARFNPDGTLDTAFGDTGIAVVSLSPGNDIANCLAVAPNGAIVLSGAATADMAVLRLTSDGNLDEEFSDDGVYVTDLGYSGNDTSNACAVRPDGKPVVLANAINGSTRYFGVAQFATNGAYDASFDGDGLSIVTETPGRVGYGLALYPDGRILSVGYAPGSPDKWSMFRWLADGSYDPGFGTDVW
jgi:uncharacterized delta-60 repeat protein